VSYSTKPQWQKGPNLFCIATRNDPIPKVLEVPEHPYALLPIIDEIKESHGH
jgi:hypothetical protein